MANETVYARGTKEERREDLKKSNSFKPSTPAGYVRPKPILVPAKSK